MWPWEHAAVGYLVYSLSVRRLTGAPPSDRAAWALLFGTLVPDLVDKTLSWGLGLFPTGYAVGHSIFVAVPVGVLVLQRARGRSRALSCWAFVTGYWSHLVGDVLSPLRAGDPVAVERLLWPVVVGGPYEESYGLERGLVYLGDFVAGFGSMGPAGLALTLVLPALTVALGVADGLPGVGPLVRASGAARRRLRRRL